MAKRTLTLTKDHLKLASCFFIEENNDNLVINKKVMLSEQSHLLDDVSLVLGLRDKMIPNTECDADGMAFPDDIEHYMVETYRYVSENIYWIELLIHQQILNGGVTEGTYEFDTTVKVFTKVE